MYPVDISFNSYSVYCISSARYAIQIIDCA